MKWDKVVCIYARKDGLFEGRFSTGRGKAEKRGYCYFHADSEEEAVKKLTARHRLWWMPWGCFRRLSRIR